jgi:hypothetical protein
VTAAFAQDVFSTLLDEHSSDVRWSITIPGTTLAAIREQADRALLDALDRATNGNVSEIARLADVTRDHVRDLMEAAYGMRVTPPPRTRPKRRRG